MNNYDFWNQYLCNLKKEIIKLCKKKDIIHIDLHIHSSHSADGKQSISEIINNALMKNFDIISITDHDSVGVYDELFEIVKNKLTNPLIIPGIEFTVDNKEYGSQCHMLQLFINPKDNVLINCVKKNQDAMFNRSKIQFKRLKENISMQTIFKDKKIKVCNRDFMRYLKKNNFIPEYETISCYLMDKLKEKNVTTFDVLNLLEINNMCDIYEDRKKLKLLRYSKLREKYKHAKYNNFNPRFLLSMLAVREVDDDWWDLPSSGSLSVNSYGQLKINELCNNYKIIFAHPTENKVDVVKKIVINNPSIIGLEKNYRNYYSNIKIFNDLCLKYKLLKTIGSDSHDNTMQFYENISFYEMSSKEFLVVIKKMFDK